MLLALLLVSLAHAADAGPDSASPLCQMAYASQSTTANDPSNASPVGVPFEYVTRLKNVFVDGYADSGLQLLSPSNELLSNGQKVPSGQKADWATGDILAADHNGTLQFWFPNTEPVEGHDKDCPFPDTDKDTRQQVCGRSHGGYHLITKFHPTYVSCEEEAFQDSFHSEVPIARVDGAYPVYCVRSRHAITDAQGKDLTNNGLPRYRYAIMQVLANCGTSVVFHWVESDTPVFLVPTPIQRN